MGKKPPTRTNSIFAWKHDFKFIDSSANGVEFAYCKLCKVDLKISSGGKMTFKGTLRLSYTRRVHQLYQA